MSTVKANTIEPASGGTVTITGAALTTPALGTPASGTLTNCTGLPASAVVNTPAGGISATTVQAALEELDSEKFDKAGGTITGNLGIGASDLSPFEGARKIVLGNGSGSVGHTIYSANNTYGGVYFADGVTGDQIYRGGIEYSHNVDELRLYAGGAARWDVNASGHLLPVTDNTYNHGSGSYAIKQIYSNNSLIVVSDARLKTTRPYSTAERAVAQRIRALGLVYQWNDAIAAKGTDRARLHFGVTVQSVIAAFEAEGLDPFRYGTVCYDEWDAEVIEHPAVEAREAAPAVPAQYETRESREVAVVDGQETELVRTYLHEISPAQPAMEAVSAADAWTETVREAGNRYSLRLDQLAFFIATAGA